ncbi:MAG: flagellar basal body rod protein FlgC [Nitrospinota bacterium]
MDFLKSLKISSSGMSAQRKRMNHIASNLANMETTRTAEGGPYKRKDVVFKAEPVTPFGRSLEASMGREGSVVTVEKVVEDQNPPRKVYRPNHPDADREGYVAMPNVNQMEEMVDMISATRSYEANAAVVKASKSMALKALEIGNR